MSAPTYAKGTTVTVEKSKAELDGLLGKHGAGQRGIMHDEERGLACVVFALGGNKYRIEVPMPERLAATAYGPGARVHQSRPNGWTCWSQKRRDEWVEKQHDQAVRERWRGLVLLVKAKLEIVRMGVSSFEREFLADRVLPNGATVHQVIGDLTTRMLADGPGMLALPPGDAP